MKRPNLILIIVVAAFMTTGITGLSYGFHSGGVGECSGCHSMHSPKPGGTFLLVGSDPSSTCLDCHASSSTTPSSFHVMTYPVPGAGIAPVELTPGGDFGWLLKTYTYTVRGTTITELGQTHGHNTVALDFSIAADSDFPTSPGGTFPTSQLACTSCHDPHGKWRRIGGDTNYTIATSGAPIIGSGSYNNSLTPTATQAVGVYRLLQGGSIDAVTFPGVPIAVAPSTYNQSEAVNQVRVAYGYSATGLNKTNWGEWCGTCHPAMHSGFGNYVHPTEQPLGSTISGIYQTYVNSGNTIGGTNATSYLSLVPFMESTSDFAVLKTHANNDGSYLNGPAPSDRVSCFSCHRSHASGFMDAWRWNNNGEFITYVDAAGNPVWPGTDTTPSVPQFAQGRTSAEMQTAYYNRPVTVFGPYQRALCNKCHAQD